MSLVEKYGYEEHRRGAAASATAGPIRSCT